MTAQNLENSLGLPDYISHSESEGLSRALRRLWLLTTQRETSTLADDLALLRRWFDPVAQGQRLRKEIASLPELNAARAVPDPPLTMRVAANKYLVTPEGRCAIDLMDVLSERANPVLGLADFAAYDRILTGLYRDWSRHRLQSVVDLLEGTAKPLQVAAAGVVIALLVNRCTSDGRALTRFAAGPRRNIVDHAFFAPVQAFADVVTSGRRDQRSDPRLISGWMLHEAGRRLGDALVVEDASAKAEGRVWIQEDAVEDVVRVVARDLQRGNRATVDAALFGSAYDTLVERLRDELPALASLGVVHERPLETGRLRAEFLSAINAGDGQ